MRSKAFPIIRPVLAEKTHRQVVPRAVFACKSPRQSGMTGTGTQTGTRTNRPGRDSGIRGDDQIEALHDRGGVHES